MCTKSIKKSTHCQNMGQFFALSITFRGYGKQGIKGAVGSGCQVAKLKIR